MDLQNLKANWSDIHYSPKNELELEKMTAVKNHPVLRKIKLKLVIETVAISLFLTLYYSGFDGADKPLYANVLLVMSAVAYIVNGVLSFKAIQKPIQGKSLRKSMENYYNKIKNISRISLLISIFYLSCLLLFFSTTINFTGEKKWILLFGVILLIQAFLWSSRIWKSWLRKLTMEMENFE